MELDGTLSLGASTTTSSSALSIKTGIRSGVGVKGNLNVGSGH